MVSLIQLWLPILLAAVGVFVASSIMHMVLRFWHSPDYHNLSNEDEVRASLRKGNPVPGMYIIPYCKPEDMKKPESLEKYKVGPVGFLILRPNGMFNMGTTMGQWFLFCLLTSLFCAYVAASTLASGTAALQLLRVVGTVGFMAYGFGVFPMGIWWGQPWVSVFKTLIDGLIYGMVTAAVFASLWPK